MVIWLKLKCFKVFYSNCGRLFCIHQTIGFWYLTDLCFCSLRNMLVYSILIRWCISSEFRYLMWQWHRVIRGEWWMVTVNYGCGLDIFMGHKIWAISLLWDRIVLPYFFSCKLSLNYISFFIAVSINM